MLAGKGTSWEFLGRRPTIEAPLLLLLVALTSEHALDDLRLQSGSSPAHISASHALVMQLLWCLAARLECRASSYLGP